MAPSILQPLRLRDFRLLWTGEAISLLGDGIYFVAVAFQAYALDNDPAALGVVGFAWMGGMTLFLMGGGIVADRFPRRRVMMGADLARAGVLIVMGILSLTGALELWMLATLAALYGGSEAFFGPAFSALIPELVPESQLVQANAVEHGLRPLAQQVAGPVVGGVVVALLDPGGAFLIDAGTFVISFLCLAALRVRERPAPERTGLVRELREGFAYVRSQTWLWATLVAASLSLLVFLGPEEVLVPYIIKNDFGGGAGAFGLVLATAGLGNVAGSLFMGRRPMPQRPVTFMYLCWGVGILPLAGYAAATETWHLMPLTFLIGFSMSVGLVIWTTLMQTRVPRDLRGRVNSLDWFVSIGLTPVSFALVGPVSKAIGIDATFMVAGIGAAVVMLAMLAFIPGLREPAHAGEAEPSLSGHDEVTGRVADGADPRAPGDGGGDAGGVRELQGPGGRRPGRG
jgi:MFS family permease